MIKVIDTWPMGYGIYVEVTPSTNSISTGDDGITTFGLTYSQAQSLIADLQNVMQDIEMRVEELKKADG